jgi:hypothetical protein
MRILPPHTVVVYATLVATILVVSLVREGVHQGLVFGGSVWAFATLGLWRSSWTAWLFLVVVVHAGSLTFMLVRWPSSLYVASAVLLHGTLLALLLSRPTRHYTRRGRARLLASFGPNPPG